MVSFDRYLEESSSSPPTADGEVVCSAKQGQSFPLQLFCMLEDSDKNGTESIVSWLPGGYSFKVHRRDEFMNEICPLYFNQSKFKSFQRQLLLYGFEKKASLNVQEKGSYSHPQLLRGEKELAAAIRRVPKNCSRESFVLAEYMKNRPAKRSHATNPGNQQSNSSSSPPACRQQQQSELTTHASNMAATQQHFSLEDLAASSPIQSQHAAILPASRAAFDHSIPLSTRALAMNDQRISSYFDSFDASRTSQGKGNPFSQMLFNFQDSNDASSKMMNVPTTSSLKPNPNEATVDNDDEDWLAKFERVFDATNGGMYPSGSTSPDPIADSRYSPQQLSKPPPRNPNAYY